MARQLRTASTAPATPAAPLDLTAQVREVLSLAHAYIPEMRYLRPTEILVHGSRGGEKRKGTIAMCHFMRHNTEEGRRKSLAWEPPTILMGAAMCTYHLDFLIPRFVYLTPVDRLDTILHELTHIPPSFDGTSREHGEPFTRDVHARVRAFLARVPAEKLPPILYGRPESVSFLRFQRAPRWMKKGDPEGPPVFTERDLTTATMLLEGKQFAKQSIEKAWASVPWDLREAAGRP